MMWWSDIVRMTCAYDELYLPLAQQFEIGNPTYVAGKNGCEVARLVMDECGWRYPKAEDAMYPTLHCRIEDLLY